jgi:hypothetical protein
VDSTHNNADFQRSSPVPVPPRFARHIRSGVTIRCRRAIPVSQHDIHLQNRRRLSGPECGRRSRKAGAGSRHAGQAEVGLTRGEQTVAGASILLKSVSLAHQWTRSAAEAVHSHALAMLQSRGPTEKAYALTYTPDKKLRRIAHEVTAFPPIPYEI